MSIIVNPMTEAVINKPAIKSNSTITKPKPNVNISKPIRTLPTIPKQPSPKTVQTIVPAPIIKPEKIEENNEPITPENEEEEYEEISIGSEDEAEEPKLEEDSNEAIIPIKKTRTKTKTGTIERLLNNSTVKTLVKGSTMAGGGILGTIFTVLIMFKLIKAL